MYYMGLDIETDDPCLKDRGKQKAKGPSWIFGEGRVICTGLYNGKETKAFEGNGGDFVRKLLLRDDVTIVGANIQYDMGWLLSSFGMDSYDVRCSFIDVAIVESLIDEYQDFSLDALAVKYLKEHKKKSVLEDICLTENLKGDFRQHLGKLWDEGYSREVMDYVASDADQPLRIWNLQKEIIERDNLWEGFHMNMDMIPVVVGMQQKGVRIDVPKWEENCKKAQEAYERLKGDFEAKYGKVNINSPKQLSELLDRFDVPYKKRITVKGYQPADRKFTQADCFKGDELSEQKKRLKEIYSGITIEKGKLVLYLPKIYADRACTEILDRGYCAICNPVVGKPMFAECAASYDIVRDLVQYKQVKNIVDKFLGPVFGRFLAPDGRLHGNYNIVGARHTGRLSCKLPNLQQLPSKTKLFEKTDHEVDLAHMCRECFIPDEGQAFVKLDYSGQENRVVAHFASGKNGDFVQGEYAKNPYFDEHDYVAKVSGLEEAHGKKVGRKYAKNLRFGVSYGMQKPTMMKNFGWSKEFCDDLYDKVAGAAPWLFEVMEQVQEVVLHRRYIRTLAGRHIHLRKGRDKDAYKYMNYLIQGSAADMTKKATVAINRSRKGETMILTVHDEDCFSVPMTEEGIDRIVELQYCMEHSSDLRVPAVCNPEIGPNWADGIEWSPEYGDVRTFIREVFKALRNGTFYKLKEKLGNYNGDESFAEFCENLDSEEEDDE